MNCGLPPYIHEYHSLDKYDIHNTTDLVTISPNSSTVVDVRTINKKRKFELEFEIINALIAPFKHPVISIIVKPKS